MLFGTTFQPARVIFSVPQCTIFSNSNGITTLWLPEATKYSYHPQCAS